MFDGVEVSVELEVDEVVDALLGEVEIESLLDLMVEKDAGSVDSWMVKKVQSVESERPLKERLQNYFQEGGQVNENDFEPLFMHCSAKIFEYMKSTYSAPELARQLDLVVKVSFRGDMK